MIGAPGMACNLFLVSACWAARAIHGPIAGAVLKVPLWSFGKLLLGALRAANLFLALWWLGTLRGDLLRCAQGRGGSGLFCLAYMVVYLLGQRAAVLSRG